MGVGFDACLILAEACNVCADTEGRDNVMCVLCEEDVLLALLLRHRCHEMRWNGFL